MMRIVLDTNVLARVAMSPRGPAREVFDCVRSEHLLIVSLETLAELARVLAYDRVRRVHQLDERGIEEFVENIATGSLTVRLPESLPRVVPDDADDDALVATAVAETPTTSALAIVISSTKMCWPTAARMASRSWTTWRYFTPCDRTKGWPTPRTASTSDHPLSGQPTVNALAEDGHAERIDCRVNTPFCSGALSGTVGWDGERSLT